MQPYISFCVFLFDSSDKTDGMRLNECESVIIYHHLYVCVLYCCALVYLETYQG